MKAARTCTQDDWNVSLMTGSHLDGAMLTVFRVINNKFYYGDAHNKWFENSEIAWQFALEHGYTKEYRKGWCPRCRVQHWFCGARTGYCAAHSYPYEGCEQAQASFDADIAARLRRDRRLQTQVV